ncbi:MAG: hypothetical protein AAB538_01880 [Patescibacteria group bacterium]
MRNISFRTRSSQRGSINSSTLTLTFGVGTLVIITLLGFFYLQQVLHTASQGTDVHELESKLIELKREQQKLELEGAQLRSLQTVEERIKKFNLAPTDRVTYLLPVPDHVAALVE